MGQAVTECYLYKGHLSLLKMTLVLIGVVYPQVLYWLNEQHREFVRILLHESR